MSGTTETISATMDATTITIHRVVEGNVRAVVARDNAPGFSFLEDFQLRLRRLPDPLHRVSQPWIWRIFYVLHKP
jgi:hypothetical protein